MGQHELGTPDLGEFLFDQIQLRRDRGLVAVLRAVKHPRHVAAGQGRGPLADHVARHLAPPFVFAALGVVPMGARLARDGEFLDDVPQLRDVAQHALLRERPDDLDDLLQVVFARERDHVALVRCRRHEPEAHLCDDAVVGLAEDAVNVRAVRGLERLPRRVVRPVLAGHGTHAGSE